MFSKGFWSVFKRSFRSFGHLVISVIWSFGHLVIGHLVIGHLVIWSLVIWSLNLGRQQRPNFGRQQGPNRRKIQWETTGAKSWDTSAAGNRDQTKGKFNGRQLGQNLGTLRPRAPHRNALTKSRVRTLIAIALFGKYMWYRAYPLNNSKNN